MAGFTMIDCRRRWRSLLLAALIVLPACSADAPAGEPPLAGARLGGAFTLTDQNGRRVSDTAFAGKYRLVYFGYTYCPDVCPVDLQTIGRGLTAFEKEDAARASKVQPIFITTDPARDTPQVLREYVASFHPRLIGLSGSEAEIADVAKKFGVVFAKREEEGATDYLVDHSRIALLFGPKGEPIAIVPHDQGPEGVAAELGKWVR